MGVKLLIVDKYFPKTDQKSKNFCAQCESGDLLDICECLSSWTQSRFSHTHTVNQ
ncbi:hypothetical protein RchiOBHm_Chr5g0069211 [Rosa chinensis]|uniref:Uncharacterized protein n=1 Tax=Rosa chinensis TaxID=74649 RepID=A0A2P6QJW3_ROSCH|nr:hypothetical protein RchiOBHm_Chr5g0069211 [Rosa chinensis]